MDNSFMNLSNPYSTKTWSNYFNNQHHNSLPDNERYKAYEYALSLLPQSYKIWRIYLIDAEGSIRFPCMSSDFQCQQMISRFEKCLRNLHKMPRIWLEYCSFLMKTNLISVTRRTFDRALKSLSIPQHECIWNLYVEWIKKIGNLETIKHVYNRYLMYDSSKRLDFAEYLSSIGKFEASIEQYLFYLHTSIHHDDTSQQLSFSIWLKICDACTAHANQLPSQLVSKVEQVIRYGIRYFTDEVGNLWCKLAAIFFKIGNFEKARDIFDEGLVSVSTIRDFTLIFESFVSVEEMFIAEYLRQRTMLGDAFDESELNLRLSKLEYLLENRPIMISSVLLRQNPNNVHEWIKRSKLLSDDHRKLQLLFIESIKTINPQLADGKFSQLWLLFAKYYEDKGDILNAKVIFNQATKVLFKSVDELAIIWCSYVEFLIRQSEYDDAINSLRDILFSNSSENSMSLKLIYNTRIWCLYLDLEESLGSLESLKSAFTKAIDLKVVSIKMILNYCESLENKFMFEESYTIYEQAINIFDFPQVKPIWIEYISKFMNRYESVKLERLRDLFEQVLQKCPSSHAAIFFIEYAKMEEAFGLDRHAASIYSRACLSLPDDQKYHMYLLYITKVEQFFGIAKTRGIYDKALTSLNDDNSVQIAIRYADMEKRLGEIDRSRSILRYTSQLANPKKHSAFWVYWKDFEEKYGSEETFRELLKIERAVNASFEQTNILFENTT